MQTRLYFFTPETFQKTREYFGKREEINKDKLIDFLLNRNRGLKGEITKLKNNHAKKSH